MNHQHMKTEIERNIGDAEALERLFLSSKTRFKSAFFELLPNVKNEALASFWKARLETKQEEIAWGTGKDLLFVSVLILLTGFAAKVPALFHLEEAYFYPRNIGFLALSGTTLFFLRKNNWNQRALLLVVPLFIISLIYIHLLPQNTESATLILACIHVPLLLVAGTAVAFSDSRIPTLDVHPDFLRFLGDLAVISAVLLLSGGLVTGLTLALFSIIGLEIEDFFFNNIVVFALPSVPLVGTFLIQNNPQLVSRVSPVIARLFSPVILIILLVYLGAIIFAGEDPYRDREFLLLFNLLIIGVMALLFFSVAESSSTKPSGFRMIILAILSSVTVLVNGIALSAILFRLSEWGISPNRLAVMGANVIMLIHILVISVLLWKIVAGRGTIKQTERAIVKYFPVYVIWIMIVVFLFPLFFGFT